MCVWFILSPLSPALCRFVNDGVHEAYCKLVALGALKEKVGEESAPKLFEYVKQRSVVP